VKTENVPEDRQIADRRTVEWDISHGPKNYLALVSAQVGSALFSFGAVWLATHLLGATGYGWVVGIVAASQAVAQLAINWTSVSVSRFGVEEFVETGVVVRAFWTRFWILLPNVLLVVATSALWLPPVSSLLKLPAGAYGLILGNFLANSLWVHIQQALQGTKLMRLQAALLMLERLIVFSVIALAGLTQHVSWVAIAFAYILGPIGAATVGLWRLRTAVFPISWIDRSLLPRVLQFSWPMIPASLVGYLSTNYLDAFFITHFLSEAHLGVYAVAYQLCGMALQLPLLGGSLLLPLFVTLQVNDQEDRARRFITDVLPVLTLAWGVVCAASALVGSYLFPLVFGAGFKSLDTLLWPLMAATGCVAPVLMGYAPFSSSKSVTYIAMIGAASAALLNVLLDIVLIPRFGLVGCAWATTIAYGINMLVVVLLAHSRFKLEMSWTIWSVLPVVIGAAYASISGARFTALALTLLLSGGLALLYRRSLVPATRLLRNYRIGGRRAIES
jgi:O-antigen/teichoic acid export membrane protein